jgi:hypothetical protein
MRHGIFLALISVLLAADDAHAQSFDGIYRGSRKTTKMAPYVPGILLECNTVGQNNPLEFRVTGSAIALRYLDFELNANGQVAKDGSFRILGLYPVRGVPNKRVSGAWTGKIDGGRISGKLHAVSSSGECFGEFSARR